MSKKDNIDELFRDSMDDFRIEPPKEAERKVFATLFWSNLAYKYKGFVLTLLGSVLAATGVWLFVLNNSEEKAIVNNENKVELGSSSMSSSSTQSSLLLSPSHSSSSPSVSSELSLSSLPSPTHSFSQNNNTFSNTSHNSLLSKTSGTVVYTKEQQNKVNAQENIEQNDTLENKSEIQENIQSEIQINQNITAAFNQGTPEVQSEIDSVITKNDSLPTKLDSVLVATTSVNDSNKKEERKKLPFDIFMGPGFAANYWDIKGEGHLPLSMSTNTQYTFFAGVNKGNMSFSSGVGYEAQKISNESYSWTSEEKSYSYFPVLEWDSINQKNDTVKWDSALVTNIQLHSAEDGRSISLNYLYVPLRFAYAYNFPGDKHILSLQAGVGMRFLISSSQNDTPKDTMLQVGALYVPRKFFLDYSVHLNYGYNINKHITIMAGVMLRQYLALPVQSEIIYNDGWENFRKPMGYGAELKLLYKF